MLAPELSDPWQWVAAVGVLVVCLILTRRVLGLGGSGSKNDSVTDELAEASEEYPDLGIPKHVHLELAQDPPTGMQISNPRAPYEFENEFCKGRYIFFHTPTCSESEGAGSLDFGEYFKDKKRIWELRFEFRFKEPPGPDDEVYFGIEMEKYVRLSEGTKRVGTVALAAIKKALGGLYSSYGDDPDVCKGELEKPVTVVPLWAFDQFVETPEGETAPSLTDVRFPEFGKKRASRISEYVKELDELKKNFRVGATYQFAFWGNSRWLDVLNWSLIGIPMLTPLDFDNFAGRPPVYAVMYKLDPDKDKPEDKRHLNSRKRFYFRTAIWSSKKRPPRELFEKLTGQSGLMRGISGNEGGAAEAPGLRQRLGRSMRDAFMGSVTCCSTTRR
jgi:hypothetical protein